VIDSIWKIANKEKLQQQFLLDEAYLSCFAVQVPIFCGFGSIVQYTRSGAFLISTGTVRCFSNQEKIFVE